jgi:hypothetical protein
MSIERRDDFLTDAQGRALAGAAVYYCTQPASTGSVPPSPLATVYSDLGGDPATNPQYTDGFGNAVAYLDSSVLYTLVFVHPLFGPYPVVLTDQIIGSGPSSGVGYQPFAGVPSGTVNGVNRTFTLRNGTTPISALTPAQVLAWVNYPLIQGLQFTVTGNQLIFAVAPHVGDNIFAQGLLPTP